MSESDRRKSTRITYFCEAELEGIDVSRLQVRIADLSVEGAFVDARTVLPSGSVARLRFTVLGKEITVQAEVRYSMPSFGMGMRFLGLSPESLALIERLIAEHR
ncbi:MAG TPA: PilZ domain-containing protein [Vicinamibacterales bacterium]|jgi:hypothetical protein